MASREEAAAVAYLRVSAGEPWRWTEDGAVLTWTADGGTVVFRNELLAILEWLAPRGLPAFPALATLLAACRGRTMGLDDLIGPADAVKSRSGADSARLEALRRDFRARCARILDALQGLEGWPRETLAGARAKAVLAEAVFERSGAWVHPPEQAREIVEGLLSGLLTDTVLNRATGRRLAAVATLQALTGLEGIDSDALGRRLRTGTELPLMPATLPPDALRPPAELARQLMAHLGGDPACAGLARAARDLLAALSLPRRLPEGDESATGGVADVANRGSLDQLLLSELAHDDLTLAVRVALNEALYLRHEPPATARAVSLALLLDAGVRMWGVPRLFAAAAALALSAADARRPGLRAWRADGSRLVPVDLLSADGFGLHLGALTTEAHPGPALPAFFSALEPADYRLGSMETEAVILTSRDTLADPEFRRVLDGLRMPPGVGLLVATVDRDGRFELRPYPHQGPSPLCEVTIRLDEIQRAPEALPRKTAPPLAPAPLLDTGTPADLPAILSRPTPPCLLPVCGKIDASHAAPGGWTFAVCRSRRLLSWRDTRQGATVHTANLPPGRTLLLHTDQDAGHIYVLKDIRSDGGILLAAYNPASGEVRTVRLAVRKSLPLAARMEGGVILLFYSARVEVFRAEDGERLASFAGPEGARWRSGRYYRIFPDKEARWCYATWDGLVGKFHPINGDVGSALVVFDRVGRPGPWMLTERGEVCHVESRGVIFSLGHPVRSDQWVRTSRDGHHLYVASGKVGGMECIDLKSNRAYELAFDAKLMTGFTGDFLLPTPQYPLMTHFTAVCVISGNLALRNRSGWWWQFAEMEHGTVRLRMLPRRDDPSLLNRARPFAPLRLGRPTGYRLKVARWPDGSRAFLDNRGLLHLKFAGSPKQFSLALTDSPSALWTSDGDAAGADFFLGPDQPKTDPAGLLSALRALCERLR